ncbi:MAG: hypothetical protein NVSMB56_02150 [Pyrinomonadaceae bacterium]
MLEHIVNVAYVFKAETAERMRYKDTIREFTAKKAVSPQNSFRYKLRGLQSLQ